MKEFDFHTWLNDTAETINENLKGVNENEANDRFYEILAQEIDTAVIYYVDAVAIILSLGAFSGYEDSEFFPFTNISQIAYHALYEEATEKLNLNVSPDMTTVLIE